jgi:outer membrane protein TolC
MKHGFGKQLLQNKWVVPLSAMVLTLAIGSFALAGTGADDRYSFDLGSTSTSEVGQVSTTSTSFSTTTSLPSLDWPTVETTAADAATAAADAQLQQAKEKAILDLIRDEMTAEDKVVFDQLRTVAAQQQQALGKAQADLQATKAQIMVLVDKYLGVPNRAGLTVTPWPMAPLSYHPQ